MEKRKVSWAEFQGLVAKICREIANSNWRPDYVVGITRGGLLPAVMISQYFNIPCETLKVSLRDHGGENPTESNLWMAEDAFGYADYDPMASGNGRKKILIVDDINDTGATVNWILEDWPSGCLPDHENWENVFGNNVRFATVFDNLASKANVKMTYVGEEINKAERDIWIDFPFENWWTK
jgi:xanthine phosphoribosyltransferase